MTTRNVRPLQRHRLPQRLAMAAFAGAFALGMAYAGSAAAEDVEACTAKKFDHAKVEKACKSGGRPAAKKLMKDVVKKAKAAGADVNCKTCHSSLKSFELTDGASKQLGKWL